MSRMQSHLPSLLGALTFTLGLLTWSVTSPALAAPAPQVTPAKVQDDVVLVGGTLHVGDGTVIENAIVRVQDGRITTVTSGADASPPSGENVIDTRGKTITPGFIAADTALGLVEIGAEDSTVDASGGDGAIHASYDASTAINAHSSVIAVQAIEGVTTAAVTPRGGLISGQVAWIDLLTGDDLGIVAQRSIAMRASLGQRSGSSRAVTLASLAEVFDDAQFYASRKAAFDRRGTRDLAAHRLDLDALAPVLSGKVPLVVAANRVSDLLALLEFADRYGIKLTVISAGQSRSVAKALADAKANVIVKPSHNIPGSFERIGQDFTLAGDLEAAGVNVGIATLEGQHNLRNVKQEAGIAIAAGMTPAGALRGVTLAIAEAYGMQADYGTVAARKVANIVVWPADPFELSTMPSAVYIRGRAVPMRSRQTELRDRYLRRSEAK